jgi:hypothetical protein
MSGAWPFSRFARFAPHSAATDAATGNVVLFGGYRNGYVSDTWTWG